MPPGQVERPEPGVGVVLHDREQGPADPDAQDDAQHRGDDAEDQPSREDHAARLLRRTSAGGHQGQGPGLPAGADRERRAGQEHHLEQRHHHDQHDDRDERVVGRGLPLRELGREHGVRGRVLDDRARQHGRADLVQGLDVVPRDRAAAHQPGRLALGRRDAQGPERADGQRVAARRRRLGRPDDGQGPAVVDGELGPGGEALLGERLVDDHLGGRRRPAAVGEPEQTVDEGRLQVELGGLDVEDTPLGVDAHPPSRRSVAGTSRPSAARTPSSVTGGWSLSSRLPDGSRSGSNPWITRPLPGLTTTRASAEPSRRSSDSAPATSEVW